ncbi:TPA: hypothetical protein ACH3X2_010183 [Trebouxia sp. C0005]
MTTSVERQSLTSGQLTKQHCFLAADRLVHRTDLSHMGGMDVVDRTASQHWRDMEQACQRVDSDTLFFGPKKHIQDLWALIDAQKKHILDLEHQLCSLGVQPKHLQQQQLKPQNHHDQRPAVSRLSIKMAGSVLGHEHQIMQCLQQFVQHHVMVDILSEGSNERAAAIVLIHRMKPRLPSDEIQALLASVQGSANHGLVIVIFMHNIASRHERTLRPAGPNNTEPGCWQQFMQQCRLVTDMTFDEARFEWHDINRNAAALVADTLSKIAASQADKHRPQG